MRRMIDTVKACVVLALLVWLTLLATGCSHPVAAPPSPSVKPVIPKVLSDPIRKPSWL